jgi:hypothetical protein
MVLPASGAVCRCRQGCASTLRSTYDSVGISTTMTVDVIRDGNRWQVRATCFRTVVRVCWPLSSLLQR